MTDDALLDVNVLIALVWPHHLHHSRAHAWLGSHPGGFLTTPITESALIRLSLNRTVTGTDVSPGEVLALVAAIRRHPQHRFLPDDSSLAAPHISISRLATARQTTDLHLVNLCALHGIVLITLDRGITEMLEPVDRRHVAVLEPAS
jgi:uncharacterized protein